MCSRWLARRGVRNSFLFSDFLHFLTTNSRMVTERQVSGARKPDWLLLSTAIYNLLSPGKPVHTRLKASSTNVIDSL